MPQLLYSFFFFSTALLLISSFCRQKLDRPFWVCDLIFHGAKDICCSRASAYVGQKVMKLLPLPTCLIHQQSPTGDNKLSSTRPQVILEAIIIHDFLPQFFQSTSLCCVHLLSSAWGNRWQCSKQAHCRAESHPGFCRPVKRDALFWSHLNLHRDRLNGFLRTFRCDPHDNSLLFPELDISRRRFIKLRAGCQNTDILQLKIILVQAPIFSFQVLRKTDPCSPHRQKLLSLQTEPLPKASH